MFLDYNNIINLREISRKRAGQKTLLKVSSFVQDFGCLF